MNEVRQSGQKRVALAGGVVTALATVALLTLYWAAPSIANHLPHSTWFVIVFCLAGVAILFALRWLARRYDL